MAAEHGDAIAYEDLGRDTTITFAQWEQRSNQVARWLVDASVRKGDRVALYLDSDRCLEWIASYAGIHKAGAVMVPVNTRLSAAEVATILRHAEPAATIVGDSLIDSFSTVRADGVARGPALLVGVVPSAPPADIAPWNAIDGFDDREMQVPLDLDDPADIMYTSGTTGLPKGVLVRHRNVAMMPNCEPHWSGAGWLHGAPLFTFAGMSFIFNPMKMGLCGLYLPRFDVDRWFALVAARRPAMAFLVPAMAELLTASPQFDDADLSSLFAVSIGSAPLAPATLAKLQAKMPQASVANSYGLTEAGPAFIVMPKEEAARRVGSVGKPVPPMEIKIVDPDSDAPLPADQTGELLVRLPGKRREYYKDDAATNATWTDDGWLRTGDLAHVDADGFVYISGRIKDMIIRGGNNIYATDIEAVLLEHPDVQEAAVVGVPHPVLGEDVGAFVVRKPKTELDEATLLTFCAERLADYKRPRVLRFVDELPRNATGKVMKHKLREEVTGTA